MSKNMQEVINFINMHYPLNTPDHMEKCVDHLAQITDVLLLKQRFLILSHLLDEPKLPSFFPQSKQGIFQFIAQQPKITECISAQQMHFVCKLYEFFIQSPDQLAHVTEFAFKDLDSPNFTFLIYSVIPSIFGYFSCHEHLAYAYQYYTNAVMRLPQNAIEIVLRPFFLSSATLYYIEAVYEDVHAYFCHDIQLSETNLPAANIEIHAKTLSVSIIKNLCLLPVMHVNLLVLLSQRGWPEEKIIEFLVRSILIPQISMMLNVSHFTNHINAFLKVAERSIEIFKSSANKSIFNNITSIVDIPAGFLDFEQHYIRYASSLLDASILFASAHKCIELPKILVKLGLSMTDKQYVPVLLKMYPKVLPPVTFNKIEKNVVFTKPSLKSPEYTIPSFERLWRYIDVKSTQMDVTVARWCEMNTQISSKFKNQFAKDLTGLCQECIIKVTDGKPPCQECQEKLKERNPVSFADYLQVCEYDQVVKQSMDFEYMIQLKSCLNLLQQWISNADRFYDNNVLSIAQKFIKLYIKSVGFKNATFNGFISQYDEILRTNHNTILFLSTKYEMILDQSSSKDFKNLVSLLKQKWRYHMDTTLSNIELPQCFSGIGVSKNKRLLINQYYMRISVGLESISLVPLHNQFLFLMSMIDYIARLEDVLKSGEAVLKYALKNCSNDNIIFAICFISATLGKSVEFIDSLNSRERMIWQNLEGIMIRLFDKDAELRKIYYQLQNEIFSRIKKYV